MTNGRDPFLPQKQDFISIYRDLISIETVAMLNAAFCDYHIKHCPASEQLVTVCREVRTACGLVLLLCTAMTRRNVFTVLLWLPPYALQVFKLFNEARAYVVEAEKQYDCQDFHVSTLGGNQYLMWYLCCNRTARSLTGTVEAWQHGHRGFTHAW